MKRIYIAILSLLFSTSVLANDCITPLLNKVILPLQAETWITTNTALVSITVNAALNDQGMEQIQTQVLLKLKQIAGVDWHITSFDRQQDKSGLENVQIAAQVRLQQTALADLRSKAKKLSVPGETYTVELVQFTPSEDEIRAANTKLRTDIYQQARAEVANLNTIYPDAKFYLNQINFIPQMDAMPRMQAAVYTNKMAAETTAAIMSVGNKANLNAEVIIASLPANACQVMAQGK